jgi:hypothetical protein
LSLPLRSVRTIVPRRPGAEGAAQPLRNPPCAGEPPCPEGAKQVSPGQSEAAQRPSVALGKQPPPTSVALKGRDKYAANAPQTRETERRNDPNAGITRNVTDSFAFVLHIEAHEYTPSIYLRFAIVRDHIPLSVLSCPFGAMDLGEGHFYPGRRVAAPPRRSALGYSVTAPSGR